MSNGVCSSVLTDRIRGAKFACYLRLWCNSAFSCQFFWLILNWLTETYEFPICCEVLKWFLNEAKLLAEKVNSKNQAGCVLDVDLIMIQKVDALCFNLICIHWCIHSIIYLHLPKHYLIHSFFLTLVINSFKKKPMFHSLTLFIPSFIHSHFYSCIHS